MLFTESICDYIQLINLIIKKKKWILTVIVSKYNLNIHITKYIFYYLSLLSVRSAAASIKISFRGNQINCCHYFLLKLSRWVYLAQPLGSIYLTYILVKY